MQFLHFVTALTLVTASPALAAIPRAEADQCREHLAAAPAIKLALKR